MIEFIHIINSIDLIHSFNQVGEAIFRQVMTCIGGTGSNKSYIENFVEVLLALSKKYYDNLVNYMNAFVNESGFPSDKVGSSEQLVVSSFACL